MGRLPDWPEFPELTGKTRTEGFHLTPGIIV